MAGDKITRRRQATCGNPSSPYRGDGTGPDIWAPQSRSSRAVRRRRVKGRSSGWSPRGEKRGSSTELAPDETVHRVSRVPGASRAPDDAGGGGIRSLNVALEMLDLYVA